MTIHNKHAKIIITIFIVNNLKNYFVVDVPNNMKLTIKFSEVANKIN